MDCRNNIFIINKFNIINYLLYWVIYVHDRIKIAKEFAETIKSDDIKLIMLFGSVARGDDNEESDIDILIVSPIADKIKPEIHKIAMDIILEKDEVISPRLMTEDEFKKVEDYPFLTNVLKEGVVIG